MKLCKNIINVKNRTEQVQYFLQVLNEKQMFVLCMSVFLLLELHCGVQPSKSSYVKDCDILNIY